jgi:hypothetical protein
MMAKREAKLTHERAVECFEYDTATGNLIWKVSNSNRVKVGDIAGAVITNGRRYTSVDGELHMVHRLVWLHQKGVWPRYNIAQIDGDYANTHIDNLVERTPAETRKKKGVRSNNKLGIKGVMWDKAKKCYTVYAYIDGKSIFHSRHKNLDDAKVAAEEADRGIIPSREQREVHHMRQLAQRKLWTSMIKWCKGLHKWDSIDQFLGEVGEPPHEGTRLVQVDHDKPLGPGNFRWTEPGVDHRSPEAIYKANQRAANRTKYRDGHLKRKFGISHEEYVKKLLEQNGVCGLCNLPETEVDESGRIREYHVDHDHKTMKVRSLLCIGCNTGLGCLKDSPDLLRKAADYIERWRCIHAETSK